MSPPVIWWCAGTVLRDVFLAVAARPRRDGRVPPRALRLGVVFERGAPGVPVTRRAEHDFVQAPQFQVPLGGVRGVRAPINLGVT